MTEWMSLWERVKINLLSSVTNGNARLCTENVTPVVTPPKNGDSCSESLVPWMLFLICLSLVDQFDCFYCIDLMFFFFTYPLFPPYMLKVSLPLTVSFLPDQGDLLLHASFCVHKG